MSTDQGKEADGIFDRLRNQTANDGAVAKWCGGGLLASSCWIAFLCCGNKVGNVFLAAVCFSFLDALCNPQSVIGIQ